MPSISIMSLSGDMPTLENHWLKAWIEVPFLPSTRETHALYQRFLPLALALTPSIQYPHMVMEGQAWARESLVTQKGQKI